MIIYSKISPTASPNKFVLGNVKKADYRVEYAEIDHILSHQSSNVGKASDKSLNKPKASWHFKYAA